MQAIYHQKDGIPPMHSREECVALFGGGSFPESEALATGNYRITSGNSK